MEKTISLSEFQKNISHKIERIRELCKESDVPRDILEEIEALNQTVKGEEKEKRGDLSAQLSIYPLRQPSLSPTIIQTLEVLKKHHLKTIPGSMSTLILGDEDELWEGLKESFSMASSHGEVVMIITLSNACPKPQI